MQGKDTTTSRTPSSVTDLTGCYWIQELRLIHTKTMVQSKAQRKGRFSFPFVLVSQSELSWEH